MSTILVLAKLENGTGNKTTAERITSYIGESGFKTLLRDVAEFESGDDLSVYIDEHDVKALLAIHAYRSGRLLKGINIPYALILGGTDVQCSSWNQRQQSIMVDAVAKAKLIVSFSEVMKSKALEMWPTSIHGDRVIIQSQGVVVENCNSYTFRDLFTENGQPYTINTVHQPKTFLYVGGIRPIKAPLYLMETFHALHEEDSSINMIIVGPKLDISYADCCKQKAESLSGVYMFPEISRYQIHSLLRHSFALVNSSVNEGMAGAILEAMAIGTPVIARCNDGNCSLITDGGNGMLFNDTQEFYNKATLLIGDDDMRNGIVDKAKHFIHAHHSAVTEKMTYIHVIQTLLNSTL